MLLLNGLCNCVLTSAHISEGEFSLQNSGSENFMRARESAESINYRARIKGTSNYSASDLVALLQSWVQSGEASINIQSIHYNLDQSCETALDNIYALNCGSQPLTLSFSSNGTNLPLSLQPRVRQKTKMLVVRITVEIPSQQRWGELFSEASLLEHC